MALAGFHESVRRHGQPFRLGKQAVSNYYQGWVVPKHTSWREDFILTGEWLKQAGIVDHHVQKQYKAGAHLVKDDEEVSALQAFTLIHMFGGFAILGVGYFCGFVAFLWERYCQKKENHSIILDGDLDYHKEKNSQKSRLVRVLNN